MLRTRGPFSGQWRIASRGVQMRGAAARTAAVLLCFSLLGTGAGSLDPPPPAGALCGLVPAVLVHRSTALRLRGAGPARTTEENEGRHPLVEDWTSEEEASSIDKPTFDVTNPMDAMYMRRFGMLDDQPDRGEDPWDSEAERVLGELRGELDRCAAHNMQRWSRKARVDVVAFSR